MLKTEFEALALRGKASIGPTLYKAIEGYYMGDDGYARAHGYDREDKFSFVRRVFGGKVNTPRSIARKIAEEAIRANRWALRGTSVTEKRLAEMDAVLREHYDALYRYAL